MRLLATIKMNQTPKGLRVGDQVIVDGLPGRGMVQKVDGSRVTVRFRNGEWLSRDQKYVHLLSDNTYKSRYQTLQAFTDEGTTRFQGMDINVEQKRGSTRKGKDKMGKPWETRMRYPYGEIRNSKGVDGEPVDVYVGDDPGAKFAYVIHQLKPESGDWDEDKVMLGFPDAMEAKKAYMVHYDEPEKFFGSIDAVPMKRFKELVLKKDGMKIAGGIVNVEHEGGPVQRNKKATFIEKVGTQFCVRSTNEQDANFGCYPSMEEARQNMGTLKGYGTSQGVTKEWDTRGRGRKQPTGKEYPVWVRHSQKGVQVGRVDEQHLQLLERMGVKNLSGTAYDNVGRGDAVVDHDAKEIKVRTGGNIYRDGIDKDVMSAFKRAYPGYKLSKGHGEGGGYSLQNKGGAAHGGGPGLKEAGVRTPKFPLGNIRHLKKGMTNRPETQEEENAKSVIHQKKFKRQLIKDKFEKRRQHEVESSQYGQTGWSYGRSEAPLTGYMPKRETAGFPSPRGGARSTARHPTAPSGMVRRPSTSVGRGTSVGTIKRTMRPTMSIRTPAVGARPTLSSSGTSEGAEKGWDSRGRGRKEAFIDVASVFSKPRADAPKEDVAQRLQDEDEFANAKVSLKSLIPTEEYIGSDKVNGIVKNWDESKAQPLDVIRHDGKLYIWDGHHTAAARIKLGQTHSPAKIYDVDESNIESYADYGEPMTGNMGHAHIDPVTWFHPPSLTKRLPNEETRVPADNPREKNDKFLDVTKRNSKDTFDQRMKLLKRQAPAGRIPARTTLVEPHSATYTPGMMSSAAGRGRRTRSRQGRIFVSYDRRGVL